MQSVPTFNLSFVNCNISVDLKNMLTFVFPSSDMKAEMIQAKSTVLQFLFLEQSKEKVCHKTFNPEQANSLLKQSVKK